MFDASYQERQEAEGKNFTIPEIHACHYVLVYLATPIFIRPESNVNHADSLTNGRYFEAIREVDVLLHLYTL
ncbi:MAG: hypothetical protein V7L20_30090 [Nostoc sp.]|uniref:hypothetical protein n=1 Tax=Nostoc sp. TaxID=1180 RepID=UPI002FFAA364